MDFSGYADEAAARMLLARYFDGLPPLPQQSPAQRRRTCRAYGTLLRLERRSLQNTCPRPLFAGDVAALASAVIEACIQLLQQEQRAQLTAQLPQSSIAAVFDPRRLPLALTLLLRECCRECCTVRLWEERGLLQLRVYGGRLPQNAARVELIRRIVRLHGGCLLLSADVAALSLDLHVKGAAGVFDSPAAPQYLHSVLSPVCVAFYASPADQ